ELTLELCIILMNGQGFQVKAILFHIFRKFSDYTPDLCLQLIDIQPRNNLHVKLEGKLPDMLFGMVDDLGSQQQVVGNYHQIGILVGQHHVQQSYISYLAFMLPHFYRISQCKLIGKYNDQSNDHDVNIIHRNNSNSSRHNGNTHKKFSWLFSKKQNQGNKKNSPVQYFSYPIDP